MRTKLTAIFLLFALLAGLFSGCGADTDFVFSAEGATWTMGFGSAEIALPQSEDPLYIAGYHGGYEITGVLDLQRANAVWLDTVGDGVLLIGIDCVGLGIDTVEKIRAELADFAEETACAAIHVYATHTHAGIDTLGLWGPMAIDGKNDAFQANLIAAAVAAAKAAYADRSPGKLYFGSATPKSLLRDSRDPQEYDQTLYQLRFEPADSAQNGIRLFSYGAHAESLRGANTLVSRDFPGALADKLFAACGDDSLYLPGAVGGLIMTKELVEPFDAVENMHQTADILLETALSITEETELAPSIACASTELAVPLDNTVFLYYKFLGILGNPVSSGDSDTGYLLESELGALRLGDVTILLIPGEIFPELVSGETLTDSDPEPLAAIAKRFGAEQLLVLGLCNDELGYIVPPSTFLLHEETPYLESADGHYEETNSTSREMAFQIAEAVERVLRKLPR